MRLRVSGYQHRTCPRANEYRAQAKKGESPAISLEHAATAGGLTVQALSQRFLEDYARSKELRSARKYEHAILTHINPNIGRVLVDVLDREQVRDLIRKVRVRQPRPDTEKGRPRGGSEAANAGWTRSVGARADEVTK